MPRFTRIPSLLILFAALTAAPAAAEQEQATLRVVPVEAAGERSREEPPQVDEALAKFEALLGKLGYATFRHRVAEPPIRTAAAGDATTFSETELGVPYAVTISWSAHTKGRLLLEVEVTRRKRPPQEGRERVVAIKLPIPDGGDGLVRCEEALDEADLVLILSAGHTLR